MPRIRRQSLPRELWSHLLDRVQSRHVSIDQLRLLAVPSSRWFKRFPEIIVCGEGELIKTFLQRDQAPLGEELH